MKTNKQTAKGRLLLEVQEKKNKSFMINIEKIPQGQAIQQPHVLGEYEVNLA